MEVVTPVALELDSGGATTSGAGGLCELHSNGWTDWNQLDLEALLEFLLASTKQAADAVRPAAERTAAQNFPAPFWGIESDSSPFGPGARENLFKQEISGDFRSWLKDEGVDEAGYAACVAPLQYNTIYVYLASLFSAPPGYRSNAGWRIRLVGLPSLGTVILGVSFAYQGRTTSQRVISDAAAMLRSKALEILAFDPRLKEILGTYPAATSTHYDGSGLIVAPVTAVGSLDISGYAGEAKVNMARNTTLKKEIAAFLAIYGTDSSGFIGSANEHLRKFRMISEGLGDARS